LDSTVQTYLEEHTYQTLRNQLTYWRLNHEEFTVRINLEVMGRPRNVMMRIFLLLDAFK
jgi:hypothetical protein